LAFVFELKRVTADLEALPERARLCFAAACLERQLPTFFAYTAQTGRDSATAEFGVSLIRRVVGGEEVGEIQLKRALKACMASDILEGDKHRLWPYADNALTGVCYTLQAALTAASVEAARSAMRAYDSLLDYVKYEIRHPGGKPFTISKAEYEEIARHTLVQAELQRQRRDMAELSIPSGDFASTARVIQERAQLEASMFFGAGAFRGAVH
jgi:hypothetical protein